MRLLPQHIENIFLLEVMHLDHLNSKEKNTLMSIEELKALRLLKHKIENDKKARKYISEINKRYREMSDKKSNNFFKNMNPFKKSIKF